MSTKLKSKAQAITGNGVPVEIYHYASYRWLIKRVRRFMAENKLIEVEIVHYDTSNILDGQAIFKETATCLGNSNAIRLIMHNLKRSI